MDKCVTTYLISLLLLVIMKIEASVTNLDCNHGVCPQTQGAVTCTITGTRAAWYSPPSKYIATVSSGHVHNAANTGFTAALVSNTSGLITNLSFFATTDKNGTQVECVDEADRSNANSMICTIMISGPSNDAPTGLGFTAITNTSVTLYWSPSILHPNYIVNYTVEIRTTSDNIFISSLSTGSNITSINVSTGLYQSIEYQYRVVGLEPCGQYSMFTLDVLQAVPLITYTITNNTKDYTIFIVWESPPLSSHPPLLYYKVYHNTSSSLTVDITTVTNITLTGVLPGYTYIITVVPVNILGDGYPNKTIVIIPKEPMITSHSVVTTPSQYHSILSTLSTTVVMTSDTSNIITTTTSSSSSVGIYYAIGVVGGIIVFILIVVVLVLTGCIMIRRHNKNNKSSGSPLTVSLRSIKDNNIEEISSNPVYAQVNKKPQPLSLQHDKVPPSISPYLVDNDQPPPIPLFNGENEPTVPPYNESMTTQYSEVKKKHVAPHVLQPHTSTVAEEDYSVLKTGYIPHVPVHNVTAGGDYSVIKKDDVSHTPPYGISAGGDYSVLKREERESRENNSQLQQTGLYSTLNNEINKPIRARAEPKGAGGIV